MVVSESMPQTESKLWSIELILARLLRVGSIIAALLVGAGIAASATGGTALAPRLITAGLLVLLATPIMRVLVAALVFVRQREWHFALFCFVVLCALAAGIILGRGI